MERVREFGPLRFIAGKFSCGLAEPQIRNPRLPSRSPDAQNAPVPSRGHVGSRRPPPTRIDQRKTHRLKQCPDCGGPLKRCRHSRQRYVEDIPEDVRVEVTEHTVHRDWCAACHKRVEPIVPDALPGCRLGHRVIVLSAWLHYALGNTLSQIQGVFTHHLQTVITPGGFLAMWFQLQELLFPWYEQIQREALASAVLQAARTDNAALKHQKDLLITKAYIAQRARSDSMLVPPNTQVFVVKGLPGKGTEAGVSTLTRPTEGSISVLDRIDDLWRTLLN